MFAAILMVIFCSTFSSSLLNFSDMQVQSLADRFSPIHFNTPGNDFVGWIFRLTTKSLTGNMKITLWWEERDCNKQVRGIYFNSQRGKRVWPLDEYTLILLQQTNSWYNQLQLSWWLYTSCTNNNYSIFWQVKYNRKNGTSSEIVAGTTLNYAKNTRWSNFADSLQYFDNKTPLGYIWDSYGGIGFVGGTISWSEELISYVNDGWTINDAFQQTGSGITNSTGSWIFTSNSSWDSATNTMRNLMVQWSVGLSQSMTIQDRTSLLGNPQNKTVIVSTENINNATLINQAKQNMEKVCKGKTWSTNTALQASNDSVLCFQNGPLTIDLLTDETLYHDKTIIMEWGNIVLHNSMQSTFDGLDIFIDQGNLYLDNNVSNKQSFDNQWYAGGTPAVNSWILVRGNIIINGLLIWWTPGYESGYQHKLYIQWKISSLNTPFTPTQTRKDFVTDVLWAGFDNRVWLQNVFVRTCLLNGVGTDGTTCKWANGIVSTPLVIVDGKYPSRLLSN